MKTRCPGCRTLVEVPADARWRPFCSRRCKMADLGAWLDERYRFSRPLRADDLEDDEVSI